MGTLELGRGGAVGVEEGVVARGHWGHQRGHGDGFGTLRRGGRGHGVPQDQDPRGTSGRGQGPFTLGTRQAQLAGCPRPQGAGAGTGTAGRGHGTRAGLGTSGRGWGQREGWGAGDTSGDTVPVSPVVTVSPCRGPAVLLPAPCPLPVPPQSLSPCFCPQPCVLSPHPGVPTGPQWVLVSPRPQVTP